MRKKERIGLHQYGVKRKSVDYSLDIREICHSAIINNMDKVGFVGGFPIYAFPLIHYITETCQLCPIYGIEAYIEGDSICYSFELQRYHEEPHITIVAENAKGMDNLYKIMIEKEVSVDIINNPDNGLLLGTGLAFSELYYAIVNNYNLNEIKDILQKYDFVEVFTPSYYYEGLRFLDARRRLDKRTFLKENELIELIQKIIRAADECGVPVIGLNGEISTSTDKLISEYAEFISDEKAYEICVTNAHSVLDNIERIKVIPSDRFYPMDPDEADLRIRNICLNRLCELYGKNVPEEVMTRLEWELEALKKSNSGFQLILIHDVMKRKQLSPFDISIRGVWANSYTAYLMELTDFNPIDYGLSPFFVFSPSQEREIDVDINVPQDVRDDFVCELFELDYIENAQYIHAARLGESKGALYKDDNHDVGLQFHPGGVFIVPKEMCPSIPVINDHYIPMALFDYRHMDRSFFMFHIFRDEHLQKLRMLSEITGIALSNIDLDDPKLYKIFEEDRSAIYNLMRKIPKFSDEDILDIILNIRPKCFSDLVKIVGLNVSTGAWEKNGKDLLKENDISLSDIISSREDVYDYLYSSGIDEEIAFYIAEECRKGKLLAGKSDWFKKYETMLMESVPTWYIESMKKINYLLPKAFCINICEIALRMLYFKIYHTEEFIRLFDKLEFGEDIIYG